MKRSSIIAMKTDGARRVKAEPKRMASPKRIAAIPKYMGCLLILKGPHVISREGFSPGFTVVPARLKMRSVQMLRTAPKAIGTIPTRANGHPNILYGRIRQRKGSSMRSAMKYVGGSMPAWVGIKG